MKNRTNVLSLYGLLTLTLLTLLGCGDSSAKGPSLEGVASGGGGYSQRPTSQILEVAKQNLATIIETSPEIIFSEFPAEYNKNKLAEIIRKIEFRPSERRERDGSYLKLDYDKSSNSIYATYDFYIIYNVPSIFSLKEAELNKMVEDIQQDILHEVSHLLGIGKTSETDISSQLFSYNLINKLKLAEYSCETDKLQMKFSPYAGAFLIRDKSKNNDDLLDGDELYILLQEKIEEVESEDSDLDLDSYINSMDDMAEDYFSRIRGLILDDNNQMSLDGFSDWLSSPSDIISGAVLGSSKDHPGFSGVSISSYGSSEYDAKGLALEFDGTQIITTDLQFSDNYSKAHLAVKENFISEDSVAAKAKNELPRIDESIDFSSCVTKAKSFPLKLIQNSPIKSLKDKNMDIINNALDDY
jgi:hypothetical protein